MREQAGPLRRSSCSAPRMRWTSPPPRLCGSRASATQRCAAPSRSALDVISLQRATLGNSHQQCLTPSQRVQK